MRAHASLFSTQRMCGVLGVSRSGYYAWRDRGPSARQQANAGLLDRIRVVHARSRQTYGAPRIHAELTHEGAWCGRHRVARLMRRHGIVAKMTRRFRLTMRAKTNPPPAPNRLQGPFVGRQANRQWVSDLTFIPTRAGWLHVVVWCWICSPARSWAGRWRGG